MYEWFDESLNGLMRKHFEVSSSPMGIKDFLQKIKKGSKKFRVILNYKKTNPMYFNRFPQVSTYKKLTDIGEYEEKRARANLNSWATYSFPNHFKTFLFKFYGNTLGTGNRVAHINRDSDPSCVFCRYGTLPAPLETFTHIFYDCPKTSVILSKFINKYFTTVPTKSQFFSGELSNNENDNWTATIILDCLRYSIWQAKLLKVNISFYSIENETLQLVDQIASSNKNFKYFLLNTHLLRSNTGGRGAGPDHGEQRRDGAGLHP